CGVVGQLRSRDHAPDAHHSSAGSAARTSSVSTRGGPGLAPGLGPPQPRLADLRPNRDRHTLVGHFPKKKGGPEGPPHGTTERYGMQALADVGDAELGMLRALRQVPPPPQLALTAQKAFGVEPPKHLLGCTAPSDPLRTPAVAPFAT